MTNADMDLDTARERIASEQLIKLDEATTVNATAVKLSWKVKFNYISGIVVLSHR